MDDLPPGIHVIDDDWIYERGFRYEDLVRAADVVMTKPGYGIVSECLANGAAILYTARGRFADTRSWSPRCLEFCGCAEISHDDLFAGRWLASLDRTAGAPAPTVAPRHGWRRRHCGYDRRHAGRSVTVAKCGMRIEPRIPRTGFRAYRVPVPEPGEPPAIGALIHVQSPSVPWILSRRHDCRARGGCLCLRVAAWRPRDGRDWSPAAIDRRAHVDARSGAADYQRRAARANRTGAPADGAVEDRRADAGGRHVAVVLHEHALGRQ